MCSPRPAKRPRKRCLQVLAGQCLGRADLQGVAEPLVLLQLYCALTSAPEPEQIDGLLFLLACHTDRWPAAMMPALLLRQRLWMRLQRLQVCACSCGSGSISWDWQHRVQTHRRQSYQQGLLLSHLLLELFSSLLFIINLRQQLRLHPPGPDASSIKGRASVQASHEREKQHVLASAKFRRLLL